MDERPRLAVIRSTYGKIRENMERMMGLLGYRPKKNGFFIKPNLVDAYAPRTGIVTSPRIVEAVVRFIRKNYPGREIVVGEGCALPEKMEKVFRAAGYRSLVRRYGVRLVNLEEVERIPVKWEHGLLMLPALIGTHEYINMPKLKTHSQTSVTLSMKNQKGILLKKDKIGFHLNHNLHAAVIRLSELVKPDLNIMDGVMGLEGRGPLHLGTPRKDVNLIIGSANIYAADNAAARIMGFDIKEIEHIPEFSDYEEVGERVTDCITPFLKCDPSPWIERNVYCHFDRTLCSICSLEIEAALKPSLSNLPYICRLILAGGLTRRKDILLGGLAGIPEGAENMICIGSCCRELSREHGLPIVKGCPPSRKEIRERFLAFCRGIGKEPGG